MSGPVDEKWNAARLVVELGPLAGELCAIRRLSDCGDKSHAVRGALRQREFLRL